jgi:hypothetical protein
LTLKVSEKTDFVLHDLREQILDAWTTKLGRKTMENILLAWLLVARQEKKERLKYKVWERVELGEG